MGKLAQGDNIMSTEFASSNLTAGQLNAAVKLLRRQAGKNGFERFLRGEVTVSEPERAWCEHGGVIYFRVTSDGTTGEEWIERLEERGFRVSDCAKGVLRSPDFKPTSDVTTEVAVLKGMLFGRNTPIAKKTCAEAGRRRLTKLNAETACLLREKFTDEEIEAMGLWSIVAMHEPIKNLTGDPSLLGVSGSAGDRQLGAYYGDPAYWWLCENGFAFAVCVRCLASKL